jgi:hypothetical protein
MTRSNALVAIASVAVLCTGAWFWARTSMRAASEHEARTQPYAARPGEAEPATPADPAAQAARERLDAVRAQHAGEARRAGLVDVLADMAETQPALSVALAAELTDEEGRAEALHETLPHLFAKAPAEARSFVLSQAPRLPGDIGFVLSREAAAFDPELGLVVAQGLPVGLRIPAVQEVFSTWAGSDAKAAAHAAEQLKDNKDRQNASESVARLWAETEPQPALEWANAQRGADTRRRSIEATAATWAAAKPEAAARAMTALPQDATRLRVIDASTAAWAAVDAEHAVAFAESLPQPAERDAALTSALIVMGEQKPELAAETALRLGGGPRAPLADKVLTAWSARDPQGALRWARTRAAGAPHKREVVAFLLDHAPGRDAIAQGSR